ncbi:hypothetical protein SDRG_12249 [Saprolegnia diclina VS20]|uniref:EGF-like domain-containing protein n=1 Tax=Saprolegnia diclina (strain VS20) TaxID=1156394 RepID=T0Q947_SAPDV|nr:hypothetical protein SDRG_12249 [Saprolegnia diclina VS20]EQC29970.1 hypothetical protein SDRG_12249 [Saprolegnia diclina VS20]|eukprot:XP_008616537.1 hypothetical protein SDRG_12249 [Saprolegnia diclina VS20]
MASAWGATPPNWEIGGCRGNATHPKPGSWEHKVTNNICDSFPMFLSVDYIRVWQDTKTMSVGCDPASHPTKEFIKAHITNYTDPKNPYIIVAGGATCNSNDDCTTAARVTGSCVNRRCKCMDVWTGPRCTKYDLETVTYGPPLYAMAGVCSFAVVGSVFGLVLRLRRHKGVLVRQHEEMRREKHSESSAHLFLREPSHSDVQITR